MSHDVVEGATALWRRLSRDVAFFGTAGHPMPPDASLDQAMRTGALVLPNAYHPTYVRPVQSGLPRLLALAHAGRIRMSSVEIVTGGILQHGPDFSLAPELRRFVAVISNLYRSFLDAARRNAADMPVLREMLPPLAAFQHDGSEGPTTIPADLVGAYLGASVGVVALPATFAAHPILWTALAHETGGHDVTHADEGLLDELAAGLPAVLAPLEAGVGLAPGQLAALWLYWLDEAVADVYALMNSGPAFTENTAVMLAAMNGGTAPTLRMECRVGDGELLDPHPADILRLHIALGTIGALSGFTGRDAAAARIRALAEAFGTGPMVTLEGGLPAGGQRLAPIGAALPRGAMAQAAEAIGAYVATVQLKALGGNSIQAIETWDDEDEARVAAISAALAGGRTIAGLGDDAQLLAAATSAVVANADAYDAVTAALNAALDHSFATDPVWGFPAPDRMYVRYRPRS